MELLAALLALCVILGLTIYLRRATLGPAPAPSRPEFGETNVRLWCASRGFEVKSLGRAGAVEGGARVGFGFVVESGDGHRLAGWVVADGEGIDRDSERINVRWDRQRSLAAASRDVREEPLWDDALDGGPTA